MSLSIDCLVAVYRWACLRWHRPFIPHGRPFVPQGRQECLCYLVLAFELELEDFAGEGDYLGFVNWR